MISVPFSFSRVTVKIRLAISLISLLLLPGIGRLQHATSVSVGDRPEPGIAAIGTPVSRSVEIGRDRPASFSGRSTPTRDSSLSAGVFGSGDAATACEIGATGWVDHQAAPVSICGYRANAPPTA